MSVGAGAADKGSEGVASVALDEEPLLTVSSCFPFLAMLALFRATAFNSSPTSGYSAKRMFKFLRDKACSSTVVSALTPARLIPPCGYQYNNNINKISIQLNALN